MSTLLANKLRSFLTVFGVVIGVITVMLIASIISGIDVSVKKEVESFGTRSIFISKYNPGIHIGRMSREERMRKELTYDDAIALSNLPAVELSVPFLDITNNFFGRKILVSGGGKTTCRSCACRAPCRNLNGRHPGGFGRKFFHSVGERHEARGLCNWFKGGGRFFQVWFAGRPDNQDWLR